LSILQGTFTNNKTVSVNDVFKKKMERNQEVIRNYIEGQLSDIDRRVFDNLIATDAELAAEVQLFRDLKTVSQHKDLFDLKQKLRETVANTPIEPDFSANFDTDTTDTEGAKAIPKIGRQTWWIVLAMGIIAILAAFFWFNANETKRIQNIAQQFDIQPFETIIHFDSTDTRPLARALQAYNRKDYTEAETLLMLHLKSNSNDADAAFYLGMCQALTGHFELASATFEQTIKATNSSLKIPAQWYLALCYLHLGEANKAHALLNTLKTDALFGEKTRQILTTLDKR
jgi:TolA-binding protein